MLASMTLQSLTITLTGTLGDVFMVLVGLDLDDGGSGLVLHCVVMGVYSRSVDVDSSKMG